jgi:hypothetical protein
MTAAEEELQQIEENLEQQQGGSWSQLFQSKSALLVGTGLVLFQQITGQPSVLYYATTIFKEAFPTTSGSTCNPSLPIIASVVVGGMKLLATLLTAFRVDKSGRRPLLLIGVGLQTFALVSLASLEFINSVSNVKGFITLASLMIYVSGYQVGFGPISWLMISEIFPLKIRGKALSISVIVNFGSNILVTFTFASLLALMGPIATYLMYAEIAVLSMVFIWSRVPETKGKTLEEIQQLFQ